MTKIELSPEQEEVLAEAIGSDADDLYPVPGNKLHQSVSLCDAWTDGSYLIFVDESLKKSQKFLYYLGVEQDAALEAHFRGLTIYSSEDDRMSGRLSEFVEY